MPSLDVRIGATAQPFERELQRVTRLAQTAGSRVSGGLASGAHAGSSGILRESLVLAREASRGNWTRVPGSISILLSKMGLLKHLTTSTAQESEILAAALEKEAAASSLAALKATVHAERLAGAVSAGKFTSQEFKSTATAAASEAAALEKNAFAKNRAAESARAVANAESAMGEGAAATLSPLAYVGIGLVAVGAAAYLAYRYFRTLREESENLANILAQDSIKFSEEASAMEAAAKEAQNFSDWLHGLGADHDSLTDKISATIKAMREEAQLQREIAGEKGASKADLEKMTTEELQKELNAVTIGKLSAMRNLEHDKEVARAGEKAANDPHRAARITDLGVRSKEMAQVADALQEKLKTAFIQWKPGDDPHSPIARRANRHDELSVTVGGKDFHMSLAEAQRNSLSLSAEEARLTRVTKQLTDLLNSKKKKTEADQRAIDSLTKEQTEIQADLNLRSKYAGQLKGTERKGSGSRISLNEQQRIGAYAKSGFDEELVVLKKISNGVDKLAPPHHPPVASTHATFGGIHQ